MNHDVERFERWSSTYEDSWIQRYLDGTRWHMRLGVAGMFLAPLMVCTGFAH